MFGQGLVFPLRAVYPRRINESGIYLQEAFIQIPSVYLFAQDLIHKDISTEMICLWQCGSEGHTAHTSCTSIYLDSSNLNTCGFPTPSIIISQWVEHPCTLYQSRSSPKGKDGGQPQKGQKDEKGGQGEEELRMDNGVKNVENFLHYTGYCD